MNYTNNVRCDQIKPLERKLFRYLFRQLDYDNLTGCCCRIKNPDENITHFKEKYGIGINMIEYYFRKWNSLGMVQYTKADGKFKEFMFLIKIIPIPHPEVAVGYYSPCNSNFFIGLNYGSNKYTRVRHVYQHIIPQRCIRLMKRAANINSMTPEYGEEYKRYDSRQL